MRCSGGTQMYTRVLYLLRATNGRPKYWIPFRINACGLLPSNKLHLLLRVPRCRFFVIFRGEVSVFSRESLDDDESPETAFSWRNKAKLGTVVNQLGTYGEMVSSTSWVRAG